MDPSSDKQLLPYGIVGNCNTCALIREDASVDWMCYPLFDSASVFARLLDSEKGGTFQVIPDRECEITQSYEEDTAILSTEFSCADYAFRVIDFMPRYKGVYQKRRGRHYRVNFLVRVLEVVRGAPQVRINFDPRPDYARAPVELSAGRKYIEVAWEGQNLHLATSLPADKVSEGEFVELRQSEFLAFGDYRVTENMSRRTATQMLRATRNYWKSWVSGLVLPKTHREQIIRSAITLKLLQYGPSGAIVAAATTSIPEELRSPRTWDYRFCWVRDASYTADALTKIGRKNEAKRLMTFLLERGRTDDFIQPLYGINGETRLQELTLDHLDGFHGSKPVRIGNAAYFQDQHDIYGELIDLIYIYFVYYRYEKKMSQKYWRFLRWLVNQIRFRWERKDLSIWEFRELPGHYTFSKLMCYIGLDRAVKICEFFGKTDWLEEWVPLRDAIREDILANGYNEQKRAFTIRYGSDYLDASLLHMTYHEFLPPEDERLRNTVMRIYDELRDGPYVQRYTMPDDFGKSTSAFTICSFWMVDALMYIGEEDKARKLYDDLLSKSNHLGLFAEDHEMETGRNIGNFPQAYTHIAIINTSILLSEWSTRRKKIDWDVSRRRALL